MSKDTTSDHLRAELKSLADTLEEVLTSSSERSKAEMDNLYSRAERMLSKTRAQLGETGDILAKQTREAASRADDYVHENPWKGIGIGAAIGVVLGMLITRR